MNEEQLHQKLESLFDPWVATKIAWENVEARDYSTADNPLLFELGDPFIEVRVDFMSTEQVSVPKRCRRISGYLQVLIHIKSGTGRRTAEGLVSQLSVLLEDKNFGDNVRTHGAIRDGKFGVYSGWVTYSVQWPFTAFVDAV